MSINQFDENSYEQALIALFKEMGYQYECGYDVERDYREPYDAEGNALNQKIETIIKELGE